MTLLNFETTKALYTPSALTGFASCPLLLQSQVPVLWPTPYSLYEYALERAVCLASETFNPSLN